MSPQPLPKSKWEKYTQATAWVEGNPHQLNSYKLPKLVGIVPAVFFMMYVFTAFIERLEIGYANGFLTTLVLLGLIILTSGLSGMAMYFTNWRLMQNITVNNKGEVVGRQSVVLGLITLGMLVAAPVLSLLIMGMVSLITDDLMKSNVQPSSIFTSYSPAMVLLNLGKPYFIPEQFIFFEIFGLLFLPYYYYRYSSNLKNTLQTRIETKKAGFMKSKLTSKQTSSVKKLLGQEKAEKAVQQAFESWTEENEGMPLSLVFSGPSGTGKTQLAENLSAMHGRKLSQFNMAEIAGGTSTKGFDMGKTALIGMPAGYIESEKGGLLTNALGKNPRGIFLFDEMEKADAGVYDIFLNCLDRGWINDARGERFDCSKAVFIFTTNVGSDISPDLPESQVRNKMVRAGFRPELMGRVNRLVQFKPFSLEIAGLIVEDNLKKEFYKQSSRAGTTFAPKIVWEPKRIAMRSALEPLGYLQYGTRVLQRFAKDTVKEVLKANKGEQFESLTLYPTRHGKPANVTGVSLAVGKAQVFDLKQLNIDLHKQLKGQEQAIETVLDQMEMRDMGMVAKHAQPEGTFLLTGPSGTGKTQLVKALAESTGREFLRFDMGSFKDVAGLNAFFGAPAGYAGSDKGGQLTQAVLDYPDAIILLDEIEKAHPEIWDAFMSVFDDGMVKDTSTGEKVPFNKTMIFMTSNLIQQEVSNEEARNIARTSGYFRPEMVNRIEHIVPFKTLKADTKLDIIRKVFKEILDNYNAHNGSELALQESWLEYYMDADLSNGVRDLQRRIQHDLFKHVKRTSAT